LINDRKNYPRCPSRYRIFDSCFLERADPDVLTGSDRCVTRATTHVLMVPFVASEGAHLHSDLAAARDELACRRPADARSFLQVDPHEASTILLHELAALAVELLIALLRIGQLLRIVDF
jgi:sirohydrochlorin ferrochelatase